MANDGQQLNPSQGRTNRNPFLSTNFLPDRPSTVKIKQPNNSGAALIIVLAFVVLLTGLVVAYFSRTVTDRQVAQGSFNQTRTDQLAMSATDLIMTDLKQEIANGSTAATV